MTAQGILLLDAFGILLIIVLVNLVRTRKLHVFYGVIWLLASAGMMTIITIPALLSFVTRAVGARFPASAMTLLAFVLVFIMLIVFSMQLSLLASRQIELAQAIAIRDALAEEKARPVHDRDQ